MVSGTISLLCSRFFSPFPHGTGSLSVSQEYLALADGPAGFPQGFTCPAVLRIPYQYIYNLILDYHHLWSSVPNLFLNHIYIKYLVLQPHLCRNKNGLGSFRFDRLYSGNHNCFLLLRVLRCFSSPGLLPLLDDSASHYRVPPFGNLQLKAYLQLAVAYRSLSRPS